MLDSSSCRVRVACNVCTIHSACLLPRLSLRSSHSPRGYRMEPSLRPLDRLPTVPVLFRFVTHATVYMAKSGVDGPTIDKPVFRRQTSRVAPNAPVESGTQEVHDSAVGYEFVPHGPAMCRPPICAHPPMEPTPEPMRFFQKLFLLTLRGCHCTRWQQMIVLALNADYAGLA